MITAPNGNSSCFVEELSGDFLHPTKGANERVRTKQSSQRFIFSPLMCSAIPTHRDRASFLIGYQICYENSSLLIYAIIPFGMVLERRLWLYQKHGF
jgi:hypothetical protein